MGTAMAYFSFFAVRVAALRTVPDFFAAAFEPLAAAFLAVDLAVDFAADRPPAAFAATTFAAVDRNASIAAVAEATAAGYSVQLINATDGCTPSMGPYCIGCAGHPGVAGHLGIAAAVLPVLESALGWAPSKDAHGAAASWRTGAESLSGQYA